MWTPLEPFFLSHGYTLWIQLGPVDGDAMTLRSPDDTPCAPDHFVYSTPYQKNPPTYNYTLFFSKVGHHMLFFDYAIKSFDVEFNYMRCSFGQ